MKLFRIIMFSVACVFTFSSICQAQTPVFKPFEKLGRGIANIIGAPKEIPVQMLGSAVEMNEKYDNGAAVLAGAFSGIFKGVGWGVYRLVAGVYDVVTFPFPIPTYEYSIIEPEYVPKFRDVLEGNR